MRLVEQPYNYLRRHFPDLSDAGIQLLNGLLTYDPDKRLTAQVWAAPGSSGLADWRPACPGPLQPGAGTATGAAATSPPPADRRPGPAAAQAALQHAWFREKPYPRKPYDMPTFPSSHEGDMEGGQGGRPGPGGRRRERRGGGGGGGQAAYGSRGVDERFGAVFDEGGGGARAGGRAAGSKRPHGEV
jgi:cyclin-dependent kinase 10